MTDLHTHSSFSDGNNTPEEMVLSAIEKGLEKIGISDHCNTAFDLSYCTKKKDIPLYKAEIARLKIKYKDQIQVLCGIEQDYYSKESTSGYDYVIGSVHYVLKNGEYIPVDNDVETVVSAVERLYDGNVYAYVRDYFETVSNVIDKTNADIIGHFDLVSKFTEKSDFIDTNDPEYVAAWKKAADILVTKGVPFEINTGAISRGYRTSPYPSKPIIDYLLSKGARFILSSDAHSKDNIAYMFAELKHLISEKT